MSKNNIGVWDVICLICSFIQYIFGIKGTVTKKQLTIKLEKNKQQSSNKPFKLIHLTDFHYDYCEKNSGMFAYHRMNHSQLDSIIQNVKEEQPDLIVITGDLV
jgi:predicted MPP superfamily phosphohydrolase